MSRRCRGTRRPVRAWLCCPTECLISSTCRARACPWIRRAPEAWLRSTKAVRQYGPENLIRRSLEHPVLSWLRTCSWRCCQAVGCLSASRTMIGQTRIRPEEVPVALTADSVLGGDGKCCSLDSRADGYGRGRRGKLCTETSGRSAAGRRPRPRRDSSDCREPDGRTQTITSPSADAQVKLIRECYAARRPRPRRYRLCRGSSNRSALSHWSVCECRQPADIPPSIVGTKAGDPIEAEALGRTFGCSRPAGAPPVIVGAVKTNLGHYREPASALAALVKTIFVLKSARFPPT